MVVSEWCLGQGRAGCRLNRMNVDFLAIEFIIHKREGQSGKVAPAAGTPDDDIRILADFFHLFFGL